MGDVIPLDAERTEKPDACPDQLFASDEALIRVDPIKFEPPSECVWTCSHCGSQSFQLLASGYTVCCRCAWRSADATEDTTNQWRKLLPDEPVNLEDVPLLDHTNVIVDKKPTSLIHHGFAKAVLNEDPVALLLIRRDGSMRMWCEGAHNDEQVEWFRQRVETASGYLLQLYPEEIEEPDG
jgi:hypothetical protein